MRISSHVGCQEFPCTGVRHEGYVIPSIEVRPDDISIVLISEAAPPDLHDYYYAEGDPLFAQTTVQAFNDAGANVTSLQDVLDLGVG